MEKQYRTILKDGSLNIRKAKRGFSFNDSYHDLLKASWPQFILLFTAVFFVLNCTFGFIYFLIPAEEFSGFRYDGFRHYLEAFFFSVQTFGTIGYGGVSPLGVIANGVVTLECYTSLFVAAVLTGIIFSRFSRPSAKVMFSQNAVIRSFDGIPCFMFRVANTRLNYISDARVNVSLAIDDLETNFRMFYPMKLERDASPIFALSWTIAHDIVEGSPLYGLKKEDWEKKSAEIVVTLTGVDTTLSHPVYSKCSYVLDEILYDHDFVDVLRREDGEVIFMAEKFDLVKPVSS